MFRSHRASPTSSAQAQPIRAISMFVLSRSVTLQPGRSSASAHAIPMSAIIRLTVRCFHLRRPS
jgi:hypothetical protein